MRELAFQKWEATGNDFLFIDALDQQVAAADLSSREVAEICDRATGRGADGVVLYSVGAEGARMTIVNSDGSLGDMCGNALRCLAQILRLASGQEEQTVQLRNRSVTVRAVGETQGLVVMGQAEPQEPDVLFESVERLDQAMGGRGYLLSFGNPHYVVPFESIPEDWIERGRACQEIADKRPGTGGINCGFLQKRSQDGVFALRVFERGAGATKSCGSGACEASAILETFLQQTPPHKLSLTGGVLDIGREGRHFTLSGPVKKVTEGVWQR